jgi:DNA-binding NarL/FixJ family response regulator
LSQALINGSECGLNASALAQLTSREIQVFSLIGQGHTVSQIAPKLGVSVKTVEAHREHIKNKLGHQSSSQVAAAAVRWLDETSVAI